MFIVCGIIFILLWWYGVVEDDDKHIGWEKRYHAVPELFPSNIHEH